MRAYETMLVLKADLEEATRDSVIEKYEGVVAKEGGTVLPTTKLGKRRLAYEINKNREGFYALLNFQANNTTPAELERLLKIDESVLRYLTTVKEQ
ncbi:30S ribosomal protein S6 [Tumebacillus permanentifrigoris]|jgi:small subunit ribosomal protein S6|uniref:Small ribosomal subunit protein bS6 n=1 Tax=Tumebacillus permanentifrigoris TaxID=378543 RepID=A0A316D9R1_9BACL|nr:30S ribosomal protein S6 [Tumebacillus permanentifrigoris]PWK13373.1 SSU ribosomal protein S6P [Tumebacillus permanentifrigoris]